MKSLSRFDWVKSVVLLTIFSLLAQAVWWLTYYSSQGTTLNLISSRISAALTRDSSIWLILAGFLAGQLVINLIFFTGICYLTAALVCLFRLKNSTANNLNVALWLLAVSVVACANYNYFPNSIFSQHLITLPAALVKINLLLVGSFFIFLLILVFVNMGICFYHKKNILLHASALLFFAWAGYVYAAYYFVERPLPVASARNAKPNVIIIGLDALRPDYTSFYGNKTVHTPVIDRFLANATILPEAHTPLARTFPAWVSILTGYYPKHSHARNNLSAVSGLSFDTLAKHFQQNGYATLYATDDDAFSVIDKDYGFDRVIAPPAGIGSFFMYFMNDFPLSNLVVTTPFGKLLFPYNYANHATSLTYAPENFLHQLKTALRQRPAQPLFFAVHFNLSGWPFKWATAKINPDASNNELYKNAVEAVDQQLGELFEVLAENNLLQNTVVILLSDHGIGLGVPGDSVTSIPFYQGDKNKITLQSYHYNITVRDKQQHIIQGGIDTDAGYGGNILDEKSYHALLAFQGFGVNIGSAHAIKGYSSLLDIAPTVLALLNMTPLSQADGISLLPYFLHPQQQISSARSLFMETTLTSSFFDVKNIPLSKVLTEVENYYKVNPGKGTITMTESAEKIVNKSAQKAVLQNNWLLADIPPIRKYKLVAFTHVESYLTPPQFVLINLITGQWTTDVNTSFAQQSPLKQLAKSLMTFYGAELSYDFNSL
jgi:arylsulfatase A-like enzyme